MTIKRRAGTVPLFLLALSFLAACSQPAEQNQTPPSTVQTSASSEQKTSDSEPSTAPKDSAQTKPPDVVGNWGGPHLAMSVSGEGASLEFDCAHGQFDEPLRLDARNGFAVRGTHVQEQAGPVFSDQAPNSHAALYTGTITGTQMTIAVRLLDTNRQLGTFVVSKGQAVKLVKCK
jgi:hypothetical protein